MTHIGFTGTQQGMTRAQGESVWELLRGLEGFIAHHGDCIGADKEFDQVVRGCTGFTGMVIHPPLNEIKRAFCPVGTADVVRVAKDYLARNRDIVDESVRMIATAGEATIQLRSGTWSTVRYAWKVARPVLVVLPNGAIVESV